MAVSKFTTSTECSCQSVLNKTCSQKLSRSSRRPSMEWTPASLLMARQGQGKPTRWKVKLKETARSYQNWLPSQGSCQESHFTSIKRWSASKDSFAARLPLKCQHSRSIANRSETCYHLQTSTLNWRVQMTRKMFFLGKPGFQFHHLRTSWMKLTNLKARESLSKMPQTRGQVVATTSSRFRSILSINRPRGAPAYSILSTLQDLKEEQSSKTKGVQSKTIWISRLSFRWEIRCLWGEPTRSSRRAPANFKTRQGRLIMNTTPNSNQSKSSVRRLQPKEHLQTPEERGSCPPISRSNKLTGQALASSTWLWILREPQ